MTPAEKRTHLLNALRCGPVTEHEARIDLGIDDLRHLVAELRQEGYTIVMMHEPGILPGMPSVAVYHMHEEVAG